MFCTRSELHAHTTWQPFLGGCPSWWLPIKLPCTLCPTPQAHNHVELKRSISLSMAGVWGTRSSGSAAADDFRQRSAWRFVCGSWSRHDRVARGGGRGSRLNGFMQRTVEPASSSASSSSSIVSSPGPAGEPACCPLPGSSVTAEPLELLPPDICHA